MNKIKFTSTAVAAKKMSAIAKKLKAASSDKKRAALRRQFNQIKLSNRTEEIPAAVAFKLLRPDPGNPRKISPDEMTFLVNSIKKFGFIDAIMVRYSDRVIIAGHQRLKALKKIHKEEKDPDVLASVQNVTIKWVEFSDVEVKALNVAHNKIGGQFDIDKLGTYLQESGVLDDPELLDALGYNDAELESLIQSFGVDASELDGVFDSTMNVDTSGLDLGKYNLEEVDDVVTDDKGNEVAVKGARTDTVPFQFGEGKGAIAGQVSINYYERFMRYFARAEKKIGGRSPNKVIAYLLERLHA